MLTPPRSAAWMGESLGGVKGDREEGSRGLTVHVQLEDLAVLAGRVGGQALVGALVVGLAARDPQHLLVLQQLEVRVQRGERPRGTEGCIGDSEPSTGKGQSPGHGAMAPALGGVFHAGNLLVFSQQGGSRGWRMFGPYPILQKYIFGPEFWRRGQLCVQHIVLPPYMHPIAGSLTETPPSPFQQAPAPPQSLTARPSASAPGAGALPRSDTPAAPRSPPARRRCEATGTRACSGELGAEEV